LKYQIFIDKGVARDSEAEIMKRHILLGGVAMATVLGTAVVAFAATLSPTVTVNGAVQSQCGQAVNGVMDISIDPSLAGAQAITITTNATVKCSNQRVVTVSMASAGSGLSSDTGTLNGAMTNGGNSVNYTLVFNNTITGQGFGSGKDVPILVSGSVAQADAENAVYLPAGVYTDTVTLTITY
jgi:spore coat protein U-like protein